MNNRPIITLFLLIISLLMAFLFVVPEYQRGQILQKSLATIQAEYEGQASYRASIKNVLAELDQRQGAVSKIDSALPETFSVSPIVYFFQKKAADHGLTITATELSLLATNYSQVIQAGDNKHIRQMAFVVHLTGPYQGIKNFLVAVERSARVFQVNTLSLKPSVTVKSASAKNQPSLYDVTLEITAHSY